MRLREEQTAFQNAGSGTGPMQIPEDHVLIAEPLPNRHWPEPASMRHSVGHRSGQIGKGFQPTGAACCSRHCRAVQRVRESRRLAAMASALREPTRTTRRLPRVTAVYSRFLCSIT